jgi:hypothetical protein
VGGRKEEVPDCAGKVLRAYTVWPSRPRYTFHLYINEFNVIGEF